MINKTLDNARRILESRRKIYEGLYEKLPQKGEEEGGCGVTGFCCSEKVPGRHIFEPSVQMHNRGNGKGGGIAAVGFDHNQLGLSKEVVESHYCFQIAVLDPKCIREIEKKYIFKYFDVEAYEKLPTVKNWRDLQSLEVEPPAIYRYFVRVKPSHLDAWIKEKSLKKLGRGKAEDEFVYQIAAKINRDYYASLGEKQAFVISKGRNMVVLKIVGYAEDVVRYYMLDDFKAHAWIAHQRYPTKGRVWHPGGAHPFAGLDDALVHNGDFANYYSVSEYLRQHGILPMFLTDTEVASLEFDLLNRIYNYPLEYIIEAFAPTTEMDFDLLAPEKQRIYRQIQAEHIHGSPDGPWFFIIARNCFYENKLQLIGITDTAMLRPQVFAYHDGDVQVGLVCSEKQAIDATLHSLAKDDPRICPVADKYWNARGGSKSNGGAFIFTLEEKGDGSSAKRVTCTDKFGTPVTVRQGQKHADLSIEISAPSKKDIPAETVKKLLGEKKQAELSALAMKKMKDWDFGTVRRLCSQVTRLAKSKDAFMAPAIEALTLLNDRRYDTGSMKRASVLQIVRESLREIFLSAPMITLGGSASYALIDWETRGKLRPPKKGEKVLIINAKGFQPEGHDRDSKLIVDAYRLGWKSFITFNVVGQRFHGVGLGSDTIGILIHVYDSSGDYLASGIDGLHIHIHDNGQDQLGQIMKRGRLVVHGDVGQTFMYGAKGGCSYILGNAAGRPLINGVGRPKVVINGTCLDYLAESFMAGDPLNGGGFVILNGLEFDDYGKLLPKKRPYPGSNLFSLASGGAIYIRDPHGKTVEEQLNGGSFLPMTDLDWDLIRPFLQENERLFGITVDFLLTVDGKKLKPSQVYRKIGAVKLSVLSAGAGDDDVNLGLTDSIGNKKAS